MVSPAGSGNLASAASITRQLTRQLVRTHSVKYEDGERFGDAEMEEGCEGFTVSVNCHEVRDYQASIPKPVMLMLGSPTSLKCMAKGKKEVEISAGEAESEGTQE